MRRRFRQRWYRLRDGLRDRVWALAAAIDPAVGQANEERMLAIEELQCYVAQDLPIGERAAFMLFATPHDVAERALEKASAEDFFGPLERAIRPTPWSHA